ncbi:ABC exporter membrane fusion protein [Synechocystis sp. PCC 6714]|uniref:ABC exporter membrane fusion protein n=1 Tax=Synechocystis sp. (strain PCC 6714) TaxID=1147 RepID=UPI0004178129|nr:ABC exporter membrane fusion protein [Synechocystis sp. PCC 6714]AIE76064.1 heterocyst specific ABC-transporter, membrane fusion protein DevB-like [Synechocystis sp. PCC 6714]
MQTVEPSKSSPGRFLSKVSRRNLGIFGILTAIAAGGAIIYQSTQAKEAESTAKTVLVQPILSKSVVALGRLEPQGEVIKIAASGNNNRIAQLLVKSGDIVEKGQIIAVLDSRDRLEAELKQAKEQVQVHQAKLAQVKAGAKTGEIGAQRSTIQRLQAQWQGDKATQQAILIRLEEQLAGDISAQKASILKLEAELNNAKAEYQRYRQLNEEGAVSASIYDSKGLLLETSRQQLAEAVANLARTQATGQQQIQEAKAALERIERTGQQQINEASSTLDKVAEVRTVDVQTAQAEVNSALAAVKKAQADLDLAYVRSPQDGQVLKVHTWEGEIVGNEGIIELGQTAQMVAVAEVYESDVKRLKLGQTATVTSDAFSGEAVGQVKEIGLQIYKNNVLNTDPTAATDARIVEVKVLLDPASSSKVQALTNLEVTVAINTQ